MRRTLLMLILIPALALSLTLDPAPRAAEAWGTPPPEASLTLQPAELDRPAEQPAPAYRSAVLPDGCAPAVRRDAAPWRGHRTFPA